MILVSSRKVKKFGNRGLHSLLATTGWGPCAIAIRHHLGLLSTAVKIGVGTGMLHQEELVLKELWARAYVLEAEYSSG